MKTLKDVGVCDDSVWPYLGKNYGTVPDMNAFALAKSNVALEYARLDPDNPGVFGSTLTDTERNTISQMSLLRI